MAGINSGFKRSLDECRNQLDYLHSRDGDSNHLLSGTHRMQQQFSSFEWCDGIRNEPAGHDNYLRFPLRRRHRQFKCNRKCRATTLNWFNVPTGGTAIGTGTSFTTPVISSSTDYYVSAGTGTGTTTLGPNDLSIGTYAAWSATAQWLNFSVLSTTTIQSVDMFFSASVGSAFSIVIRDASTLANVFTYNGTVSVTSTTIADVIPINATLIPGNYQMNIGATIGTYRNSTGGVYPYTVPGVISITGSTFDPVYYYMFYRWVVGSGCQSPPVLVTATITPPPSISVNATDPSLCPGGSSTVYRKTAATIPIIPMRGHQTRRALQLRAQDLMPSVRLF